MRKKYIDFCKNSKYYALFIAIVYVITIVMMLINGIGVDIKFTGGALLKYSYSEGSVELSNVEKIAETTLGRDVTIQENTDALGNKSLTISVAKRVDGKSPVLGNSDSASSESSVSSSASEASSSASSETSSASSTSSESSVSSSSSASSASSANKAPAVAADKNAINVEEEAALIAALEKAYPDVKFENAGTNSVSASMGKEFLRKSILAVIVAGALVMIYIAIRFRKIGGWRSGLCSVVSLLVALSFVFVTFIIMGTSLNENFIAVLLTILGYAINDTIIVYDRVRENMSKLGRGKIDYTQLINDSLNSTLSRTINTTITTSLAIGTVAVIALIFKIESIVSFAFPMLVGIIIGTLSTLFVAGPLWVKLQKKSK